MRRMTRGWSCSGVTVGYPRPVWPYARRPACRARISESFGRVSASARQVVIGLDIGTTSAKAVAFDPSGATHGDAQCAYPMDEPEHGHAEQDPAQVLEAAERVLRGAAAAARDAGAEVAGVGISTAMHALAGADADGRPVTPVITWADTRAADEAERLRSEHPELHDRTGTPLHPMSPLPKLMWLREHEPETFAAVRRWGGLKELVLPRLAASGRSTTRSASGTGLLDLDVARWDARGARARGVEPSAARDARPDDRAVRAHRGGGGGDRPARRPAGRRGRRGRAARERRRRGGAAGRGGVLDRDERRAAARRRAAGGRPAAAGVLLRARPRAVGRRRRDQQRRRRAAVGGRGARARPRLGARGGEGARRSRGRRAGRQRAAC